MGADDLDGLKVPPYNGLPDLLSLLLLSTLAGMSTEADVGRIWLACLLLSATVFKRLTVLLVGLYRNLKEHNSNRAAR